MCSKNKVVATAKINMAHQIDNLQISRNFSKSALKYEKHAKVQYQMALQLISLLSDFINFVPNTCIDIGCGTGYGIKLLKKAFPDTATIGVDLSLEMLKVARSNYVETQWICSDMSRLPFPENTCDIVFSNAAFQWAPNATTLLQECYRVLSRNGILAFATFGESTLWELKRAFQNVDHVPHVHDFLSVTEWKQAASQFEVLSLSSYIQTFYYQNVRDILHHLKNIGATFASSQKKSNFLGKYALQQLSAAYETYKIYQQLPLTWEIILAVLKKY